MVQIQSLESTQSIVDTKILNKQEIEECLTNQINKQCIH